MTQIQIRRGTSVEWTSANPVLAEGELGFETNTLKLKIGNGSTAWTSLGYQSVDWAQVSGKPAVIAAGATAADARTAISAASLDVNGKVPVSELPNSIMAYQGTWDVSGNSPALADGTGNPGDVYRVTVGGSRNLGSGSISFGVGDYVIYNPAGVWEKADTTDAVASVAGQTGNVTLTKSDVGLANVDNTADADKPVSTATQTALNAKEGTITAGTSDQYYRGDKTFQTLDKTAVGLANVDNTSDATKNAAVAALTNKTAVTSTGTVTGLQLEATATTGTAPLTVSSTTAVTNLNADLLDGQHASAFVASGGALGTPSSGTLTNATGLPVAGIAATGTRDSTTYLRGDGTWAASSGGISTGKAIAMAMVFG